MRNPLLINRSATDTRISIITFIAPTSFTTHEFVHVLDSLVRVSRRVEWKPLDTMGHAEMATHSHKNAYAKYCVNVGQHNSTLLMMLDVNCSRNIRTAGAEPPCPRSSVHLRTDSVPQGKKHHMHPNQTTQHDAH